MSYVCVDYHKFLISEPYPLYLSLENGSVFVTVSDDVSQMLSLYLLACCCCCYCCCLLLLRVAACRSLPPRVCAENRYITADISF